MPVSRASSMLVLSWCLLLASVFPPSAGSQGAEQPVLSKPIALVVALPWQGAAEEGVRKVLDSAMRLELERQGLQTILFASTDEQTLVRDLLVGRSPDFMGLLAGIAEFTASGNHDFVVLAGYTQEGEEIQVDFGIADAQRGTALAAVAVRAPIDFRLDHAIIGALRELLPRAEGRIAEVARRRAAEYVQAAADAEAARKAAEAEAARVAAAKAEAEKAAAEDVSKREEEARVAEAAVVAERFRETKSRFRHLEFSLGFAPFIPLGEANSTLGLGFSPFLYADYRLPTAAGILGIGLYSGVNVFTADDAGLASYFKYVVPVGVDVRFSGPEALRLGMFVRGGAGAGINASSYDKLPPALRDDLGRVYPYVYGGIGARLGFSEGVGLAMDVLYHTYAYFWQESSGKLNAEWIMGFVPSLYLFTRL